MDSPRGGGSGGGGDGGRNNSHGNTGKSGQSGRGALEQSAHSSGSGDYDTGSGDSSQMPFCLDEDGSPQSGTLTSPSPSGAQPIPRGQYHNQQPYQHSAYHHLQPHSAPAQQQQQQHQQHHSVPVHQQQQQQQQQHQQHHSGSERQGQFSAEKTLRGVGGVSVAAAAAVAMHVRDAAAAGAGTFAAAGNWLSSSPLGRRTVASSLPGRVAQT